MFAGHERASIFMPMFFLQSSLRKEAERGKKVHGKKRERQTSVKRKDKEGQDRQTGLEEAGSAGLRPPSETQSQAQSAPSEDYQEDLESESCGESDDSENCRLAEGHNLKRKPLPLIDFPDHTGNRPKTDSRTIS